MYTNDLIYLCTIIGNLSGLPVRLFRGDEMMYRFSMVELPADPILLDWEHIRQIQTHIGHFVNRYFYAYGSVFDGETRLVVGPCRQIQGSEQELHDLAFSLDIRPDEVDDFITSMRQIVPMPLDSLVQMMCAVNFAMNDREKLTLSDVIEPQENAFGLEESCASQQIDESLPPPQDLHNTLATEQTVMNIIRKGDVAALEAFVQNAPAVRPGVMARDQLRQAKNTFIVTVSQASRAAIRGGMDVEDALSASDAYIQQCELLGSMQEISKLHYDMALYYTRHVQRIRQGHYSTELVRRVAGYVQHHLSESITTDQIADHLYMSRQHLSRRFTAEAGVPLAAFVRNEKIEESKRLLRYTDRSVTAISAYLGFSSQAHFIRVFKEKTGMTPGEYRDTKIR